jgi:hypothetical protein
MATASRSGEDDSDAWRAAGFTPDQVDSFREWRIGLDAARRWKHAGVTDGLDAARWGIAHVSPADVPRWTKAGIDLNEAFKWRQFGFSLEEASRRRANGETPDQVRAHPQGISTTQGQNLIAGPSVRGSTGLGMVGGAGHDLFRTAQVAGVDIQVLHSYLSHQWLDDEAIEWATHGIEASEAYEWIDLGLTASEAGEVTANGSTLVDVLRTWWPTGIPFDELADWIGAGLEADEAVAQRANGVTTEQAAALRALRKGDDRSPARPRPSTVAWRWGPPARGTPPADQEGARQQIIDAYAAMDSVDQETGSVPAVEGGANLAACLAEAAKRAPKAPGTSTTSTFTVDRLRFLNDHEAIVSYTLTVSGGFSATLAGRPGRAVLIDGQWKVARQTFCELMATAGVSCPPPP